MINLQLAVRPALLTDRMQIANLIYFEPQVHRHLDWRGPLDWLGAPEYWVLEQFGAVVAALACPPDPEGVAWLRLFAHAAAVPPEEAWAKLWGAARETLAGRGLTVAAITTSEGLTAILKASGFTGKQQIVVLEQHAVPFEKRPLPPEILIRPMTSADLPAVAAVDAAGFAPLWRNSEATLRLGLEQTGLATVAEVAGEIWGYQISTRSSFGAHLARLAVLPQLQRRSLGYWLVQDLIQQLHRLGLNRLTVNTQNDNLASLALYQKIGFRLTGERYAVYTQPL